MSDLTIPSTRHTPSEFFLFRYQLFVDYHNFQTTTDGPQTANELYKARNEIMKLIIEALPSASETDKLNYSIQQKKSESQYLLIAQENRTKTVIQNQEDYSVLHQPYVWIAIDMSDNVQTIAISSRGDLHAKHVATKLTEKLQRLLKKRDLDIQVHEIKITSSFWNYAKSNEGQIKEVGFIVCPPNMPGLTEAFDREISQYAKGTNAKQAEIIVKAGRNDTLILNEQDTKLQVLANYSEAGGGDYYFKTVGSKKRVRPLNVQQSIVASPIQEKSLLPPDTKSNKVSIFSKLRKLCAIKRKK